MKANVVIWLSLILSVCINEPGKAQTNVSIVGKLDDSLAGSIDLRTDIFLIWKSSLLSSSVVDKSGNFHFQFNITKPQIVMICNRNFLVTPGDKVYLHVTGSRYMPEKILFGGPNANPYNYSMKYDSLIRSMHFKYYEYDFQKGLAVYLDNINANNTVLLKYLKNYSDKHMLTNNFKQFALNQIKYDYYNQVLYPFVHHNISLSQIPPSYSSIIDQIKFNDDDLLNMREYVFAGLDFINFQKLINSDDELHIINNNFSGLTKQYLLAVYANSIMRSYNSKDSLKNKKLFEEIDKTITNPEIRNCFNPIKDRLNIILAPFPKNVLLTTLTDSTGSKLTFKGLMEKFNNKIIVLDFWASWCSACIGAMPNVGRLSKEFGRSEVEFVFMSLDDYEKSWKNGMEKLKIPGSHFWIDDNFKSSITQYLLIQGIPRYVIINKAGKIERFDASGPNESDFGLKSQISKMIL